MTDGNGNGNDEIREAASTRRPPALLLERLALGELDEGTAEAVRRELAASGRDDALTKLAADDAEILADYPPERMAAEIRRRAARADEAAQTRRGAWAPWLAAPVVAMVAAVILWLGPGGDDDDGDDGDDDPTIALVESAGADDQGPETTRLKGGVEAHLVVDRKTAAGHERLRAGELVGAGDLLQLSYVPAGHRFGVIVSLDGVGVVTLHHPSHSDDEPRLGEGREVPLTESYQLDDAPDFERFVLVTRDDDRPPPVAEVLAAAERLAADPQQARAAPLPLAGPHWRQYSLLLRKPPRAQESDDAPAPSPAGEGEAAQKGGGDGP